MGASASYPRSGTGAPEKRICYCVVMPDDTKTQILSELVAIRDELTQIRELLAWARLDLAETIRAAATTEATLDRVRQVLRNPA